LTRDNSNAHQKGVTDFLRQYFVRQFL